MSQAPGHVVLSPEQVTSVINGGFTIAGAIVGGAAGIVGSLVLTKRENKRRRAAAATMLLTDLRYIDHTLRTLSDAEVIPDRPLALMPVASIHDLPEDVSLLGAQTVEQLTLLRRSFLSLVEDFDNRKERPEDERLLKAKKAASLVLNRMPMVVQRLCTEGGTIPSAQQLVVEDEPLPLPPSPFA